MSFGPIDCLDCHSFVPTSSITSPLHLLCAPVCSRSLGESGGKIFYFHALVSLQSQFHRNCHLVSANASVVCTRRLDEAVLPSQHHCRKCAVFLVQHIKPIARIFHVNVFAVFSRACSCSTTSQQCPTAMHRHAHVRMVQQQGIIRRKVWREINYTWFNPTSPPFPLGL